MANFTKEEIDIIVVGAGPSGIAIHVLTREMVYTSMLLLKYLPISLIDTVIAKYAKFKLGNLSELGIPQPEEGPFSFRVSKGRSPVIDVGAIDKIKFEQIKDHTVVFDNGDEHQFDAIIFATGYKNIGTKWLKRQRLGLEAEANAKGIQQYAVNNLPRVVDEQPGMEEIAPPHRQPLDRRGRAQYPTHMMYEDDDLDLDGARAT
ncbi:probable indole-3-pyruvate monooxygenase YUCCA10 [Solanum tuberosum]|uniref:probable indole-3-pyruvate monooxygenase YUCCA10 n=1 Tax=Solanum tuberosum TaxID=4113 RepID=UPI00073A0A01|nr:PREDICTED: probable indole-3-pyruvate monooxygenase YUCCA10 [Solanum tuberosum]